jgi:hypothetical protein
MAARAALGRQWGQPRSRQDLADQAARVAANNAKSTFPKATARELRLETIRADLDD